MYDNKFSDSYRLDLKDFEKLFFLLKNEFGQVMGPKIHEKALSYGELFEVSDLPIGFEDEQRPGFYRIQKVQHSAYFSYVVGPESWKKFLFPPSLKLWQAKRLGKEAPWSFEDLLSEAQPMVLLGVRACELAALHVQDKVFLESDYQDAFYKKQREKLFIVAVECVRSGEMCFCASMNSGPSVGTGFDLALTEIYGEDHHFVMRVASDRALLIVEKLKLEKANKAEVDLAISRVQDAAEAQTKKVDPVASRELLKLNLESTQWDEIASRCMSCANCTMVCPTCFCSTVEDTSDLSGDNAERWRKWDSCFNADFSSLHGHSVRSSTKSRYRQWLNHKFNYWHDQFDTSGCTGCGRCITWCPVGIDLSVELPKMKDALCEDKS